MVHIHGSKFQFCAEERATMANKGMSLTSSPGSTHHFRFHACLGQDHDKKQDLYSTHVTLNKALENIFSFMGLNYDHEAKKHLFFRTDDGEELKPDEDYPMDYDALMGKEWYKKDKHGDLEYHDEDGYYPIVKKADLVKMFQDAIDKKGKYILRKLGLGTLKSRLRRRVPCSVVKPGESSALNLLLSVSLCITSMVNGLFSFLIAI